MLLQTEPSVQDVCGEVMGRMWEGDVRDFVKNVGVTWLKRVTLGIYDVDVITNHVLVECWHFLDGVGIDCIRELNGFSQELKETLFGEDTIRG